MRISIIVAASTDNVIGKDGGLPWHLPEDLRRFKTLTMGKPMIMGRATWDSIGRALPGRQSIVLSRQSGFEAEGCDVVASVEEAIAAAGDASEIMIIGGSDLYQQFLPRTDRVYLTRVHTSIEGDTFFPELSENEWIVVAKESYPPGPERDIAFDILSMDRV
jgi:dihydrofolate reductase